MALSRNSKQLESSSEQRCIDCIKVHFELPSSMGPNAIMRSGADLMKGPKECCDGLVGTKWILLHQDCKRR